MIKINYQGFVRGPTALFRVNFTATGTTPDEVLADANRQIAARNLEQVTAIALNNNASDWIQVFGAPEGTCAFADYKQVVREEENGTKN